MKKLLFMLLGIAATMNVMAVNYSATATLNLSATSGYGSVMYLQQSNAFGELDGAEMYMDVVGLYAIKGTTPLQIAQAADFTNVHLGLKTDASTSYTITVSGVTGAQTLVLFDLYDNNAEYELTEGQVINFTATANSTIEDRFVINYVAPAPACTEVRTSLNINQYYTICLPQDVVSANASFWSMSKRGEGVAYIEEVDLPLEAGKPYIFQAEENNLCVVYGNAVPAAQAGAEGVLVGTFAAMGQADLDGVATSSDIYLLKDNELVKVNGREGNELPANRAYIVYNNFVVENPTPAPGRRVRAIPMHTDVATGIDAINANEAPAKTMIDGKLYIIRGEHMFDATGRMVK